MIGHWVVSQQHNRSAACERRTRRLTAPRWGPSYADNVFFFALKW